MPAETIEAPTGEDLRWIHHLALRVNKKYCLLHGDFEDLLAAGVLGFIEAKRNYDPSRINQFRIFAVLRVRGAMIDFMRSQGLLSGIPRADRRQEVNGHAPSVLPHIVSMDAESGENRDRLLGTNCLSGGDCGLPAPITSPEELLALEQHCRMVDGLLEKLPSSQYKVLISHYFHELNFSEIARANGWTRSWVSKLHRTALLELKQLLQLEETRLSLRRRNFEPAEAQSRANFLRLRLVS